MTLLGARLRKDKEYLAKCDVLAKQFVLDTCVPEGRVARQDRLAKFQLDKSIA